MGPPLRKRQRLEFIRNEPEEVVRRGLLLWLHLQHPVDVSGPATVHLAGAGRGERLDRHDLSRLEEIVAVGDVWHALPCVKKIPLDCVARQIANRAIPVRLDRPLDPLPVRPPRAKFDPPAAATRGGRRPCTYAPG